MTQTAQTLKVSKGSSLHVVSLFLIQASWFQRNLTAVAIYHQQTR